jgi:hypothetical protein
MENGTNGKTPIFVCSLQTEDETDNFLLFAANGRRKQQSTISLLQTEDGNGKLPIVCCKWKRKTEVCFFLGR